MAGTIGHLELLPVFVEVVRQGSFTAAAKQLPLPKSTVSRRVSALERELGAELLSRTTRTVRLTEAGADLYEQAAPAIARLEDAARALSERQRTPRGTLRATAPVDIGHELMADIVASFVARYPAVHVDMVLTNRLVDLAGEGFDLAIRAGHSMPDSSALVARRVGQTDFGLFVSAEYAERRGVPERPSDLAAHDCVLFRSPDGKARWKLKGPEGEASVDVRGPVSADDFTFVRASVRAGIGVGLVPVMPAPDLIRVLPSYSMPAGAVWVVYRRTRHLAIKVRAFRDHVLDAFRRDPCSTPIR
jgi:DNA-binding transcriptional LysR family regulator